MLEDERYVEGHALAAQPLDDQTKSVISVCNRAIVHVVRGHLEYRWATDGEWIATSPQFGQTTFVGENRGGPFTDEEAPKKSITDCLGKCALQLGMSADVHLGAFDDNKYVSEYGGQPAAPPVPAPQPAAKRTRARKADTQAAIAPPAPPLTYAGLPPAVAVPPRNVSESVSGNVPVSPGVVAGGAESWTQPQWQTFVGGRQSPDLLVAFQRAIANPALHDNPTKWPMVCDAFAERARAVMPVDAPERTTMAALLGGERERIAAWQQPLV